MASDKFTLILNNVPKCVADGNSLLLKSNLAVFTCGHLICSDCLGDKALPCVRNDNGRFAFFLNDDEELKKAADYLRAQVPQFVDTQSNELGQKVMKHIERMNSLVQRRLKVELGDVRIEPPSGVSSLHPYQEERDPSIPAVKPNSSSGNAEDVKESGQPVQLQATNPPAFNPAPISPKQPVPRSSESEPPPLNSVPKPLQPNPAHSDSSDSKQPGPNPSTDSKPGPNPPKPAKPKKSCSCCALL